MMEKQRKYQKSFTVTLENGFTQIFTVNKTKSTHGFHTFRLSAFATEMF